MSDLDPIDELAAAEDAEARRLARHITMLRHEARHLVMRLSDFRDAVPPQYMGDVERSDIDACIETLENYRDDAFEEPVDE